MATSGDFDEGRVKRCDAVGASDDYNGTDDPGSDSSEEERAASGSDNSLVLNINASILQIGGDNLLNFKTVDDPIPSKNPSKIKSGDEGGPVLRELWKPRGLLSVDRSRLGFPNVSESESGEEERASSGSENAIVMNIVNPCIMQIGSDNVLNFSPVDNSTPSGDSSKIKGNNEGQPVLREHWKPRGPLSVVRSRLGFPDCDNDHLVQLLVCKNQHTREALDIADNYDVTVAVSYDVAGESSLTLPDYQCKRIKSKSESDTEGSMIGVVGYLFRFHESDTKFKITFSLKAAPRKRRGKLRSVKEHTACETICQISVTLETGSLISSKSGKTKEKPKESAVSKLFALIPPSLSKESTVLYKRSSWVVNQLQSRRDNAKWKDFDKYASDLLLMFSDADTHIAIKLEQSVQACYQNQPDRALQLIDEAFISMPEAKNQHLLAGRGFGYRAGISRRQGDLGKAEHYVQLAEQNIAACQTSLDTSLIAYERASMLMDFIGRTSHRSLTQVNEARRNLEKCIDVCLHVETENSHMSVMKHHFVLVLVKMTMLLLDCRTDAARKRTVRKEFIATALSCLDTMRTKYWSEMAQGDRSLFYLASSDLEYRRSNYSEAEEFARLAKEKAIKMGFKLEASHAQERLDFMRAITRGDTIDNGPQQSESEGENADISSSGAESDLMHLIESK